RVRVRVRGRVGDAGQVEVVVVDRGQAGPAARLHERDPLELGVDQAVGGQRRVDVDAQRLLAGGDLRGFRRDDAVGGRDVLLLERRARRGVVVDAAEQVRRLREVELVDLGRGGRIAGHRVV